MGRPLFRDKSGNLPGSYRKSISGVRNAIVEYLIFYQPMKKWCTLASVLLFVAGQLWSQTTISGKVVSVESGLPIEGAHIRADRGPAACSTDAKGEFSLRDLPDGVHELRVTHVSYAPKSVTVKSGESQVLVRMENSRINMEQVVVTGTGTHRRMKDSPVPVTVITARDIREANLSTLEDVLSKMDASFAFATSGMGTTMSLNGLNDGYILVLENGRRLAGNDRISRINIANIKRVEVLSGAASALYGSDAIGGVVNIITDDAKSGMQLSSDTRYGSKGRFSEAVNADFNQGKFGSYTSYQRLQADGWQLNALAAAYATDKKTKRKHRIPEKDKETDKEASTAFYSNTVNQRFTYAVNDRLTLGVRGTYYNWENDRPVSVYKYNMEHETYTYGAGARYMFGKSAYLDADFYSDNFVSRYDSISKPGEASRGKDTRKKVHYYNGSLKGVFRIGQAQKFSVGMEYVKETLMSATDNLDGENAYTTALFLQDEIRLWKNFQAVVGVRYIYNEFFKNYATPNIAMSYRWGGLNFRASYASAFRAPTLSQLYATEVAKTTDRVTIPNFDLQPEKSDYFMLNAEYVHNRITFSVSGYLNKIRDMISYRSIDPAVAEQAGYGRHDEAQQRDNLSRAEIKGVKAALNVYAGAGFSLGGSYHFMDTEDKATGQAIDKSVKNVWTAHARWGHRWGIYHLNVNLNGRIQEGRYSKTYYYDPAPGFSQWDLNTRHAFSLRSVVLEPGFGVENLFDKVDDRPWNSNYSTLNPGRSFYVSLSVRFAGRRTPSR